MKKIIILVNLILFSYAFAHETVQEQIKLEKNAVSDFAAPFLLNFFLPFGIGSFAQGDTKGGTAILIMDIASIVGITLGTIAYLDHSYNYYPVTEVADDIYHSDRDYYDSDYHGYSKYSSFDRRNFYRDLALSAIIASALLYVISRLVSIIRPIVYYKKHLSYIPKIKVRDEIKDNKLTGVGLELKWETTF